MPRFLLIAVIGLLALHGSEPVQAAKVRYLFEGWDGPALRVYASRPAGLASHRPVVIVMHGMRRNADEYRDQWHELANEHDFLLLVPEFSERDFPGTEGYNLGRRFDEAGRPVPRDQWSWSAIELLFDDALQRFGMVTTGYAVYGHSAGAQFVHRFLYFNPRARVVSAVAANAGWYTMPDFAVAWPYGLEGTEVDARQLAAVMKVPLTVLLGEADNDPDHPSLRRAPEAMLQGPHRLARGQHFFEVARTWSADEGVPFKWRLAYVPGVGHDNALMAPRAVAYLLPPP